MTWTICLSYTALWVALAALLCHFFRVARGDAFGEEDGFANYNCIILQFPPRTLSAALRTLPTGR